MELNHLLTLIRFRNTTAVVIYAIFFSTLISRQFILSDLFLLLLSNLFAVWAIYSFNDLEDAKSEAFVKKRRAFIHKNLILVGRISEKQATMITAVLALLGLVVSAKIGILNFYLIAAILLIGIAYSSNYFRLKSKPPLDILLHALIGALIPISVFIKTEMTFLYIFVLMSFFIGSSIPEILNQRYDFYLDKKSKTKTTVQILGKVGSLRLIIGLAFLVIVINGMIFFLYGGTGLALLYILLSPLLMMFLTKKVRQVLEKRPIALVIPIFVNLFVVLVGFLNIL